MTGPSSAELRSGVEGRAGDRRDARVSDQAAGEGDVVVVGQALDVGHRVIGSGGLVDAEHEASQPVLVTQAAA